METQELLKSKWKIDNVHSTIKFSARHMVISTVNGQFDNFTSEVDSENDDFSDSMIKINIDSKSINTQNNDRDNHLRSKDFLETEKYPTISFVSKSFEKTRNEKFKLVGDLTIKDVTKPIELDVTYGGTIKDPYGNTRAGFSINGSLNRFDYGLKWNNLIETGGAIVGKEIKINCDIQIVKEKEETVLK